VAHAKKKKGGGGGSGGAGGGGGASKAPAGARTNTKEVRDGASYSQETRKIILSLEKIRKVAPNGKEVLNNISLGECCVRKGLATAQQEAAAARQRWPEPCGARTCCACSHAQACTWGPRLASWEPTARARAA
jgi:hypothetical protein